MSHWTNGCWSLAPGIERRCIGIRPGVEWYSWCRRLACSNLASSLRCNCLDDGAIGALGGDLPLSALDVSLVWKLYYLSTNIINNNIIEESTLDIFFWWTKTCRYINFAIGQSACIHIVISNLTYDIIEGIIEFLMLFASIVRKHYSQKN